MSAAATGTAIDGHAAEAAVRALAWPVERVHEAIFALAMRARFITRAPAVSIVAPPPARLVGPAIDRWLERVSESIGVDAEPIAARYVEVSCMLVGIGPGLVPVDEAEQSWLAIVSTRGQHVTVLASDETVHRLPLETVRSTLAARVDARAKTVVSSLLEAAGSSWTERVEVGLRNVVAGHIQVRRAIAIRPHPSAPLTTIARSLGLARPLALVIGCHVLGSLALVLSWIALGSGVLAGRLDPGWLAAAGLLALSRVPLRAISAAAQGDFAIGASRVLKQRLLWGALRIDRDETRREGAGRLLARVLESERLETLSLDGGIGAVLALFELVVAGAVLAASGAWLALAALVALGLAGAWAIARFAQGERAWTDLRLGMTHDLVERMVGHRTRVAQEPPERWHDEEDVALSRGLVQARRADRAELTVRVLARTYLVLALISLAPALVEGASATALAGAVGGALLAQSALMALAAGLDQLARAAISFGRVAPLLRAAEQPPAMHDPSLAIDEGRGRGVPVLELCSATLVYRGRTEAALRDVTMRVVSPDRLLCIGPSGGGKSTLAQVLAGLRTPTAGLVLAGGLDRTTMGDEEWRRRISFVPQFQENHVFANTLAFNVLMADHWPPTDEDMGRADEICRELGLGSLIDRMPAGLLQQVGDSGWQLSHGERSRVFLARALLSRRARMLILDESFGALDPETLSKCLEVTLERAPALMVIAHP